MKKWYLNIRNGCKSPQNPFLGAFMGFYGLYGPKTPFLWVPETSNWVLSCRVYLVLNRSNAKLAVLYTKCQIIAAHVPFVNFWYHTIPYHNFFFQFLICGRLVGSVGSTTKPNFWPKQNFKISPYLTPPPVAHCAFLPWLRVTKCIFFHGKNCTFSN